MKLTGVVVLYFPSEDNLNNIKQYSSYFTKLIVIDNTPNCSSCFFNLLSNISYIPLNKNYGLGYALNLGLNKLIEEGYDYAMTLDQDTKIEYKNLEEYYNFISLNNNIAIISPNYIIDRKRLKKTSKKCTQTLFTMQSASVFNLKIFKLLGGFNEKLFIDCIDYDYCLKANRHDYDILIYNDYYVYHNPGITKKIPIINYKYGYCSPTRIYYQSRNLRYLIKIHNIKRLYLLLWWKLFKIIFFYDHKKAFLAMYRLGKKDFKNNIYGELSIGE